MRILFIVNHFYPELGAIRTEFEIAKELAKRGNTVLVITTFPRSYRLPRGYKYHIPRLKPAVLEQLEYDNKLRILRIKSFRSRVDNMKQRVIELVISVIALLLPSLFLAPFYDVLLIAGDIELAMGQVGVLLKILWRKPLLVILHDIHPDVLIRSGVIKGGLVIRLAELLIRLFSKWVDKVIVHSYTNAKILSKRYSMPMKKILVVELWANINEIYPVPPSVRRELKRKYVGDPNKFIVSFAGVMNPPQGLDVVIRAAKYIKENYEKYDNILFLLVGDGMDKPRLMSIAKKLGVDDIVKFLPLQPRDKYIEILQLSDACLVTLRPDYIQPVVPSKLLEIMAAGCPAVLSMPPHSDAVKIVLKSKCGIYAKGGDPKKLAQAIMLLLEKPELRNRCSINGRKATEQFYNIDRVARQYEEILREVQS